MNIDHGVLKFVVLIAVIIILSLFIITSSALPPSPIREESNNQPSSSDKRSNPPSPIPPPLFPPPKEQLREDANRELQHAYMEYNETIKLLKYVSKKGVNVSKGEIKNLINIYILDSIIKV